MKCTPNVRHKTNIWGSVQKGSFLICVERRLKRCVRLQENAGSRGYARAGG